VRRTAVLAVAVTTVAAFALGLALRPHHPPARLAQVRAALASRYYRRLPSAVLSQPTVAATIAALHDRYTTYLSPSEVRLEERAARGGYGGIGVNVLPSGGGLLVTRTVPGPAQFAGMRPGDTILTVDGVPTAGLPFDDAMGRIIGTPGSRVQLRVRRGVHTLQFSLVRRHFRLVTVQSYTVRRIGVIRVGRFVRGAGAQTSAALHRLRRERVRGIVLDLRGDPGGLLSEAVNVASVFLRPGASVVSLVGAHRPLRILYAHPAGGSMTIPLAVLVDGATASASEVVAGALKDHGRATIVGSPTFGKSLVQEIVRLPSGAALKLTVARYLTPAGVDISRRGVAPDVRSAHPLDAAVRLLAPRRRS
jgi:carboxyl-terminal processing protease